MKSEYFSITIKNNTIVSRFAKEIKLLSDEIERIENQIRDIKEVLYTFHKEYEAVNLKHDSKLKELQLEEASILLVTKNLQLKKLFKLGETNEHYLIREQLRLQKQNLHNEYIANKEKYTTIIEEKEKERDNLIINKRELKRELDLVRSSLATVYKKILRQGLDIRKEGLRWVIR